MTAAAGAEAIVAIEDLHKTFGHTEVLRGIDLAVRAGEAVVIVGSSGSGKSTVLRCINRLEEPTSGTIRVGGEAVTGSGIDLNRLRRRIGMVFQGINLYPHMTALGNVALALRKVAGLSWSEAEVRAKAELERVGLGHKAGAYPGELSGGQQQRVGIARAMALEPQVMLFDEPTSALDPELVDEVLAVMAATRRAGMTMIVVTHEMRFARTVADRVVFLDHGRVLAEGTPDEILVSPENARVRDFVSRSRA